MKQKIHYLILILFISTGCLSAQKTVRVNAVKANNFGVTYSLPKTSVVVSMKVKKTTYERGEFYQFSQRHLSIDPIIESKTEYTLDDVNIVNRGVVDSNNSYMVTFRSGSFSPFISLTEEGLIAAISDDVEIEEEPRFELPQPEQKPVDPTRFLAEETLRAGSTAKRAELVSRQIFELRQSRNDILIGDADNMPPDGEAYKVVMNQLDTQEKALTEMFTGRSHSEYFIKEYVIVPDDVEIEKMVIGRFSKSLGPIEADNLAGAPVYLSLKANEPIEEVFMTSKERDQFEKKISSGVVYNIPVKAVAALEFNNRTIKKQEIDVVQFGSKDVLTHKTIDNRKQPVRVIFYPNLGAIKQIKEIKE